MRRARVNRRSWTPSSIFNTAAAASKEAPPDVSQLSTDRGFLLKCVTCRKAVWFAEPWRRRVGAVSMRQDTMAIWKGLIPAERGKLLVFDRKIESGCQSGKHHRMLQLPRDAAAVRSRRDAGQCRLMPRRPRMLQAGELNFRRADRFSPASERARNDAATGNQAI